MCLLYHFGRFIGGYLTPFFVVRSYFDTLAAGGVFSEFARSSIKFLPALALVVGDGCRAWWPPVLAGVGGRFWFVSTMRPDSPKNRRFTRLSQKTVICTAKRQNTKKPPFLPRFRVFFWRPAWPSLFWGVHFVQSCQVAGRDGRQASGFFLGVSFVSFLRRPGWMPPGGRPWLLFDCILFGGLVCAAGRARFFFIHSLNGCFCQKTTNNRL